MPHAVATLVALLACAGCSTAGPPPPLSVQPGQPFSLRVGQSAQAAGGAWQVGFDGVTADSRCPRGAQCVWAGDVTVRVWSQRGTGPRQTLALHLAGGALEQRAGAAAAGSASAGPRLQRLEPQPVSGRELAPQDYVATLVWADNRSGAAEK